MLEQDVSLGLLPIGGRIRKTDQPCARLLSGGNEAGLELQEVVATALATERDSLAAAVAAWANQTAAAIVAHGRAVYEIAYYRRGTTPVEFLLLYLEPRFVNKRGGTFVQEIPPGTQIPRESLQEESRAITERERLLEANRLLVVSWPPGYTDGPHHIHELKWLGRTQYPDFLLRNLAEPEALRVPYNFELFREAQDRALAASTRLVGWNARGSFDRMQTGYYYCARHLRFELFKVVLRDHILAGLNEALERAGRNLGIDARVSLEGLPTRTDVTNTEELLARGMVSPKEILERFSLY